MAAVATKLIPLDDEPAASAPAPKSASGKRVATRLVPLDEDSGGTSDQPMTLGGLSENAAHDIGANIKGNADIAAYAFPPIAMAEQLAGKNIYDPTTVLKTGKSLAEGVKNIPSTVGQELSHPVKSFYDRPFSTTMDAVTAGDLASGALKGAMPDVAKSAQNAAMDAFGDTKRFINTPAKEAMVRQSVQTLMDEGVMKPFSTTDKLIARTTDLADEAGSRIGDYLKNMDLQEKFMDPKSATDAMDQLRPRDSQGNLLANQGKYKAINAKIDEAVDTIKAYGDKPLSWEDANKIKGDLQDAADWKKTGGAATVLDRVIAGKFRETLDQALQNTYPKDPGAQASFQEFLRNKKIYSAAMSQTDPLYNRLSSELGNKKISLTDWILLANPATAAKKLGVLGAKKALEKFGSSTVASGLNELAKGGTGLAVGATGGATQSVIRGQATEQDIEQKIYEALKSGDHAKLSGLQDLAESRGVNFSRALKNASSGLSKEKESNPFSLKNRVPDDTWKRLQGIFQ